MSQPADHKLLLNRQSLLDLQSAGLGWVEQGLPDIRAARELALWLQGSGTETYLFSLVATATRKIALAYLTKMPLNPDLDQIELYGTKHSLPEFEEVCRAFLNCYPQQEMTKATERSSNRPARTARRKLLAELYLLEALLANQAAKPFARLFDDSELRTQVDYLTLTEQLSKMTGEHQGQLEWTESLPELLQAPLRAAPGNLSGQVAYIAQNWGPWLPSGIKRELQVALAVVAEESQPRLTGPGPSPQPMFGSDDGSNAPAAFTTDSDWMSSAVLLAKSIHVWLDQLSSHYQRSITTLFEIPDEELKRLSGWGFNALWLIGIWERSRASKRIKQLCGNPEAEASAYALHAYRVADELGGEDALRDLEWRCQQHGIRLACDVVPNHTGIDSEWVQQHPDWFLQAEHPPYPAYNFSGPDLCETDGISIRIEDGYWDHSDAAVVCEHHDHHSGRRRYIYHGNDGTQMPWNDTAQLNFLLPEVRQAMSDLIVHIAQRFSLIRFDAAMTLARKHFRRLWFPPPGGSAGVPSRSAFWMSDADFEQAFPIEFWREVVDRVNREAPNTLLIAEAFWLMESYFVRNLGMHRVYNSAFMNMLKREENAKYRKILKDILAYNPEILKRYVNFMNNPDEATAVEQFDKGDKYFGVATMLATLPGLPMFGHGQIEGYREKYGMEYRRAYWDESPDQGFVAHHERQICPLLRIRHLFAGVESFSFYDFQTAGSVNENVYAYSNGAAGEKVLVVYNNAPHQTVGRLHSAAPKASPDAEGVAHPMPFLNEELGLNQGDFCRFSDLTGSEYLQKIESLQHGLELRLDAYESRVFHTFQLISDPSGDWHKLHQELAGRACDNLDRALLAMRHKPLWEDFARLLAHGRLRALAGGLTAEPLSKPVKVLIKELNKELGSLAESFEAASPGKPGYDADAITRALELLPGLLEELSAADIPHKLLSNAWQGASRQESLGSVLTGWLILRQLGASQGLDDKDVPSLLQKYGLNYAWQESCSAPEEEMAVALTTLLLTASASSPHPATCEQAFTEICTGADQAALLGINSHKGVSWFRKEGLLALAGSLALQAVLKLTIDEDPTKTTQAAITEISDTLRHRLARAAAVGYRLDKFISLG